MRRLVRLLGTLMIVAGAAAVVWALVVWRWGDPLTSLYTRYQQRELSEAYERRVVRFRPRLSDVEAPLAERRRQVRRAARGYRLRSRRGDPIGRIEIPRIGLDMVVVDGTDPETLKKGPGRYRGSYMPGEGELIYIAGHRTTYRAPFADIDALRAGDAVTLKTPYATFLYRIARHVIVPADDIDRLRSRGHEVLALQACHPRFFATHRYIAYARPVRVAPRTGAPYAVRGPAPGARASVES